MQKKHASQPPPHEPKVPKVLIYLFGSLGDTIVAIPALRAVRRHFRDAELTLLQNVPSSGNIVKASQVLSEDLVDGSLEYAGQPGRLNGLLDFYRLRREIRRGAFQTAVYLVISERPARSVARDKFFFRTCGITDFYGFHAFSQAELYPLDENGLPAMTDSEAVRKLKRLETDGIKSNAADFQNPWLTFSPAEIEKSKVWLADRRRQPNARLISIAPGCKTLANVWASENFIEIGQRLMALGGVELMVTGGRAEIEIAERMVAEWGAGIAAAGALSVRESGALLSLCDFHIGLDTGATHLAAAAGTRCFALYGERNNPGHWYPAGSGQTLVFHPVECAGCRLLACPLPDHPCMRGISVEAVWENLRKFMADFERTREFPPQIIRV
ncbi:MAG: glycosyltransferase family 9 protein [Acidobacteriota bacterium]|nr:glycosyltransferase family 9 protein [Acidobacteriota bacterium]